jgi:hypothetical protein
VDTCSVSRMEGIWFRFFHVMGIRLTINVDDDEDGMMAAFDTPLIIHLLPSDCPFTTTTTTTTTTTAMPPSKSEAKSTILAQFPPGAQPHGTSPQIPDTKTNLLDSTPPQIVRALAQAEPLIRGLNTVLGILTWSSGRDWLSYLIVVTWWITCLYGGWFVKFAGNFLPVIIIAVWYTTQRAGIPLVNLCNLAVTEEERTSTHTSLTNTLKEIDILRTRIGLFVTPPSLLLPHLALPGSQPLLVRLCLAWPVWLLITHKMLPPRKIVLIVGTSVLCWSAPWARVVCIALWRSRTIRSIAGSIIGQDLLEQHSPITPETTALQVDNPTNHEKRGSTSSVKGNLGGGIKITQTLYQSQRRWIGIGWTANLFPNERSAWYVLTQITNFARADETEHAAVSIDDFTLPGEKSLPHTLPNGEKANRVARWKWLDPEWKPVVNNTTDSEGWIYTDNTWKNPGPSEAFGKYTVDIPM